MIVNFVKCKEKKCNTIMEASWLVDGWVIVLDSMLTDEYKDDSREPFIASHLTTAFPLPCNKCGYEISGEEKHLGFCLVNHGDNSACVHCPKCNHYVPETAKWHKTEWTEADLIEKEVQKEIEVDDEFITFGELDCKEFIPQGKVRNLK